ncbi:hypothetical protein AR276_02630 [Stenotrophomonas maltophilia]|nr:hypothetical protein AR276_02630 [Stenotrophomonas maltophilia]
MQVHAAAAGTTRLVVPARVHARIERIIRQWPRCDFCSQFAPVAYIAIEGRIEQPLLCRQRARVTHVRREFDGGIKADIARIRSLEALDVGQVDLAHAVVAAPAAPALGSRPGVGQQVRAIDQQHRPTLDLQCTAVAQVGRDMCDEGQIVLCAVLLADQDVVVAAVPASCPVLVGPAQAERQVDAVIGQPLTQRVLHQGAAAEPIVVEAECADAVLRSQACLVTHHLRVAQVIKAEVGRQAGLDVTLELRQGAGDVAPLGKALAPPGVVLREGMELRQVESDQRRRHG